MSRRTGTFKEFQEHTLAIARGGRTVDPTEPKVWSELAARGAEEQMVENRRTPKHEAEIAKMWAAFVAREEEHWQQQRGSTKLQISLIAADDDASAFSPEYQSELHAFIEQVRAGAGEIQSFGMAMDSVDAQGGTIGEFLIELARTGVPAALSAAIGVWLHARYGRRVTVRFGKDGVEEISAGTSDEIGKSLKHVAKFLDLENRRSGDT